MLSAFQRFLICGLLFGCTVLPGIGAGTVPLEFNRDIRPIFSENCLACHGPDKNQRKAKLRLDVREVALDRKAFVPGKPGESELVKRIFSSDPEEQMPPPKANKTLTAAQKEALKRWIAEGAVYEPHWAYIKPKRWPAPATKNSKWVRNPIDAFVLHMLEAKNIQPSHPADKATLLRRLSLDLIGLPPTPEEVGAFLADSSSRAYEKQVDRLLASPHFGERMTVPWLDLVRFSDTVGYHGDQNENIFPYRDYVIQSFNQNKPFDQFTVEQVAGDLLPNPSVDAQVASGFNRLNMVTREGGAQPNEYLAKYAADRVRTVSMTWLGSTMGCAECHDHKFDPFTSMDFYSMEAFFADLKQWGVYEDYDYTPEPELRGIDNDSPFPPEIEVTSPYLTKRATRLEAEVADLEAKSMAKVNLETARKQAFEHWRKASLDFLAQWPAGWASPQPEVALRLKDTNAVAQTNFSLQADGTIALTDAAKENLTVTLPLRDMWLAAVQLEIVPREGTADEATHQAKLQGARVRLAAKLQTRDADKPASISFSDAEADHKQERYDSGRPILGVKDAWKISTDHPHQRAVWLLDKPVQVHQGDTLIVDLGNFTPASARLSLSPFAATDPLAAGGSEPLRNALAKNSRLTSAELNLTASAFLLGSGLDAEALTEVRKLQHDLRLCRGGRAFTMVSAPRGEPRVTRVLPRGNWQDESGAIVQPATPQFLPQLPNPEGRRLTRLDLAHWLVSPDNPLTARAVMNRLWKQFFGTGLSAVVEDLGAQGEWPVHPELLDWLACEFMQPAFVPRSSPHLPPPHAWDIKHMVRMMVLSSVYRQDSNERRDLKELDPNNRLVAFQTPRRLEAEFVRDNALFISGLLNEDLGGPSVFPYQPAGYYANLQFPDRDYYPDTDERQYRRGVYTHWQRTFLQPMLANFDAPSREECTGMRNVSNTPQQALTLLNDPTFTEASRVWAARLLAASIKTDDQRLDQAFRRALARPAKLAERKSLLSFLALQRQHYQEQADEAGKLMHVGNAPRPGAGKPIELAAWTQVCRVILNLHETITRY